MTQRTAQSGPVTITLQAMHLYVGGERVLRERPIAISGIVEPTVTGTRQATPDPISGVQIYIGKRKRPRLSAATPRNNGMPDAHRGHLMALELGGPNISENIVPQWANFQANGEWRQMERNVLAKAELAQSNGQLLRYTVQCYYKNSGALTPTLRTFGVPSGFRATTQVITAHTQEEPTVEFDQAQAQDETDTMISERQFAIAEAQEDPDAHRDRRRRTGDR